MGEFSYGSTLLVGVGGIGCRIVDRVFQLVQDSGKLDTERLQILAFDTHAEDLFNIGVKQLRSDNRVQTSVPGKVSTLFQRYRSDFEPWFIDGAQRERAPEIMDSELTKGAAQFRMLSRMAFDSAMRSPDIDARIKRLIAGLETYRNRRGKGGVVNVMITGSLAGGTGSGMFLQTALYVKHLIEQSGLSCELRGIFLLPNAIAYGWDLKQDEHPTIRANGYAALKELNSLQLMATDRLQPELKNMMEFQYCKEQHPKIGSMPLKNVAFIDFESQSGGNLGPKQKDAYLSTAVRTVYQLMFTPLGETEQGQAVNNLRQMLQAPNNNYSGVSSYTITYPSEEILQYLSLKLADSMIGDVWLAADRGVSKIKQDHQARVASGDTALERPHEGREYISQVALLAEQANTAQFYNPILRQVERLTRDEEDGLEIEEHTYKNHLDALERFVLERLWKDSAGMVDASKRKRATSDDLKTKETVVNSVQRRERALQEDEKSIRTALQNSINRSFNSAMAEGHGVQKYGELGEHNIHRYLLGSGPNGNAFHPIAARYFLYRLKELAEDRLEDATSKLEAAEENLLHVSAPLITGLEGVRTAKGFSLRERFRHVHAVAQKAVSKSGLFGGKRKHFIEHYTRVHNRTIDSLSEIAEYGARKKLYELLIREAIERLLSTFEAFFKDLDRLRETLSIEIQELERAHERGRGVEQGFLYVYADRSAKREMWERIGKRSLGERAESDVHSEMVRSLIDISFPELGSHSSGSSGKRRDLRKVFRESVLDNLCRSTIEEEWKADWDYNVAEAIRREAALVASNDHEDAFFDHLRECVEIVVDHASPLIRCVPVTADGAHVTEPQIVTYWAVSPSVLDASGDTSRMTAILQSQGASQPVVEEEFSDRSLVCVCVQPNVRLYQLSGVASGDPKLYGNQPVGDYHRAYSAMTERLHDIERTDNPLRGFDLTPHLDRSWHLPGILPELHPDMTAQVIRRVHEAFALGLALGAILPDTKETDGTPFYWFCDPRRTGQPDYKTVLVTGDSVLEAFQAARLRSGAVRAILEHAEQMSSERVDENDLAVREPRETRYFKRLTSPAPLALIIRASNEKGGQSKINDDRFGQHLATEAAEALFGKIREYAQAAIDDKGADLLLQEVHATIRNQISQAFTDLSTTWNVSKGVVDTANELINGRFNSFVREGWGDR